MKSRPCMCCAYKNKQNLLRLYSCYCISLHFRFYLSTDYILSSFSLFPDKSFCPFLLSFFFFSSSFFVIVCLFFCCCFLLHLPLPFLSFGVFSSLLYTCKFCISRYGDHLSFTATASAQTGSHLQKFYVLSGLWARATQVLCVRLQWRCQMYRGRMLEAWKMSRRNCRSWCRCVQYVCSALRLQMC